MRTRRKSWDQRRRERKLRMRQVLANESPEQREVRLEHLRRYRRSVRDSETPEQREARRAHNRGKMRRLQGKKRQERAALPRPRPNTTTAVGGIGGARGVRRPWEALEEAARRLLGGRWELLETLMSERRSGISAEEASDLFPREIQQGLIHVCCLCNGLLFQNVEAQKGKAEETAAAEEPSQDPAAEETPCPHTDTVQLFVV